MASNAALCFVTLMLSASGVYGSIVSAPSPPAFKGQQSGIGSWYQANTPRDFTNGHSWCGYAYKDSDPVFAPSLKLMGGATYSSDPSAWKQQTQQYCGLEAKVTDPATGKSALMYIGDSFAQPRSDGSIDIMLAAFSGLNGDPSQNKNTVIKNVQWELTGRANTQYMAPGASMASGKVASGPSTTETSSAASITPAPNSDNSGSDKPSSDASAADGSTPARSQDKPKDEGKDNGKGKSGKKHGKGHRGDRKGKDDDNGKYNTQSSGSSPPPTTLATVAVPKSTGYSAR